MDRASTACTSVSVEECKKYRLALEIKSLVSEISDLQQWASDYSEILPTDEDRMKLGDISSYLSVLKQLINLSPLPILEQIQL